MNTDQRKKTLAVTSLVLGILSFCLLFLAGIPAIITGHVAHSRARRMPAQYGGAGMAIAGFIMGYVSILWTALLLLLLAIALPAFAKARSQQAMGNARDRATSVKCVNNLKNIGLAFRIWATDHKDQFPFNASAAEGGTRESCNRDAEGFDLNAAQHFQVLAKELATPRILVCPSDSLKQTAMSFQTLQAENVSYQVRSGPEVKDTNPGEILAICPIHGHELYCDGSVKAGRGR